MQKVSEKISDVIVGLTGKPDSYRLEHRFFIVSCLLAGLAGLIATGINIWLKFSIELTITTTLLSFIYFVFYYLSFKAGKFELLVIPYIFISLLSLSYLWFINAGSNGPILYIIASALLVYIVISRGIKRAFAISAVFITVSILLFWEFLFPDAIVGYPDASSRFYDIYLTVLVSLGILSFISIYITRNYHREREKARISNQQIIQQNKAIMKAEKDLIDHKIHLKDLVKERTRELEKINIQLKDAKVKAEESDKLKTAFLSNMSHEIRTPMNAIIGFSELLKESDHSVEDREDFLEIIIEKGNLLLNIINDIIDISKVEANEIKIENKNTDINEIIDELQASYNHIREINKKDDIILEAVKQFPTGSCWLLTDPLRLKQVLSNLIDNAIKFTHKGHVKFGYRMVQDQEKKKLYLFVEDTGIGVESKMQKIIFNRFRQIEDTHTREFGGTGLGLAISKKLVELMGGTLQINSIVGKGSTFSFEIPWRDAQETKPENNQKETLKPKFNWSGKTFLVVEDNESGYKLIENYLIHTKATIIHAENGA